MSRGFTLLAAALLAIAIGSPAAAASPHVVDPSIVSPPLNPHFAPWSCVDTGSGPICRGREQFSWSAADLGLACGGRELYTTGQADISGTRWSTADGLATESRFQDEAQEQWSFAPDGSGPSIILRARFNEAYRYGTPGDLSTRSYQLTGGYQVTASGSGLVWHDVGYAYTPADPDEPTIFHGPHDSANGDLDQILPAVCSALDR